MSEFIISDRILQGKKKSRSSEPRVLKVGLSSDKENTVVTLEEYVLEARESCLNLKMSSVKQIITFYGFPALQIMIDTPS